MHGDKAIMFDEVLVLTCVSIHPGMISAHP